MQPWWWRSVAACASVLVLAGLVAVIAGAVDADRAAALRPAADGRAAAAAGPATPAPNGPGAGGSGAAGPDDTVPPGVPAGAPGAGSAAPEAAVEGARVPNAVTASSLALPPGWRVVPSQDVVEVPAGRFEGATIVQRGEGTVVLVGLADPARVPPRADPAVPDPAQEAALGAEARRLADAYADLLAPRADTADLSDDADPVAGLPTRTSVRRVEGGELDGALVRISTLAAPGRTIAVLAVARPSPTVDADAGAADAVVRSLRLEPAPLAPSAGPAPVQRPLTQPAR